MLGRLSPSEDEDDNDGQPCSRPLLQLLVFCWPSSASFNHKRPITPVSAFYVRVVFSICTPLSPNFPFYKDISHIGLGPILMISFNLIASVNTLSPNKVTKRVLRYWILEFHISLRVLLNPGTNTLHVLLMVTFLQNSLPESLDSSGGTFHVSRNTDSFSNPEMLKSGYKHNTIAQIMQTRSAFRIYRTLILLESGASCQLDLWVFELESGECFNYNLGLP